MSNRGDRKVPWTDVFPLISTYSTILVVSFESTSTIVSSTLPSTGYNVKGDLTRYLLPCRMCLLSTRSFLLSLIVGLSPKTTQVSRSPGLIYKSESLNGSEHSQSLDCNRLRKNLYILLFECFRWDTGVGEESEDGTWISAVHSYNL